MRAGRRRLGHALLAAALAAALTARAENLLVFAAASLQGALDEAARPFEAATGHRVRISYAASSALARQVAAGAPAHLFISADEGWMRYVVERGAVAGKPTPLLGNELVLIAPAASPVKLGIARGFDLAGALGRGRLALADPDTVPAGRYARVALESLGAWKAVATRTAPAADVRAALKSVARGEAPLGIVYRTDARAEPAVVVVDAFPGDSHPPIVYPMAVLRGAPPAAEALARHLASDAARASWAKHGFGPPG